MGLFKQFFTSKKEIMTVQSTEHNDSPLISKWQEIAEYLPAESSEFKHVSIIATAIAAGENPNSTFVVKELLKRNPQAELVSVIASSLASGQQSESKFIVKSIKEEK